MDDCIVGGNFFGICRFVSPLGECRSDACGSIHFIILPSCPFPLSWKFDQLQHHFVRKYAFTSTSVSSKMCLNDAPCKIKTGQNVKFPKTLCVRKHFSLIAWPWLQLPFKQVTKDDNAPILTHQIEDLVKGHKWSRGGGSQPKAMKETTWSKFHQTPSYQRAVTWPPSSDGQHQYFPFFLYQSQRSLVTNK